jgi:hypothetical protein
MRQQRVESTHSASATLDGLRAAKAKFVVIKSSRVSCRSRLAVG